uniref:Uncharacterized protein n=1 Tax=Elaeophora elaphi TaxID=1147741 RepID=A0A0R3RWB0_9BILA
MEEDIGSREASRDRLMRGTFAFGSSTPRILSHLSGITREYCDDRINPQVGRRSYTTPTFPTPRSKTAGASMNAQMRRTDGITQKPGGSVLSKSTSRVLSTSYHSKDGNEEFMNSVKKKLEAQNEKARPIKKITATKEKQAKSEKANGGKTSVEKESAKTGLPEASSEKLSSMPAGFGNEGEKFALIKEAKSEAAGKQLQIAASVVKDETKLPLAELPSAKKIVGKKVTENNSNTKTSEEESGTTHILRVEESKGREIDGSTQSKSTGQYHSTDTFAIISKTDPTETDAKANFNSKNETGQEFAVSSESKKREPSPSTAHIDSDTLLRKQPSATDKTFSLPNEESELKNEFHKKNSEDEHNKGEGGGTIPETSISFGSEHDDKLPKTKESITENSGQGSNSAASFNVQSQHASDEQKIIYNHSYFPGAPIS